MTVLIIIGVMLSTIIISAAFGTADTLSYSIRDIGINGLGTIDEIIISARAQEGDRFGQSFIPLERYEELRSQLAGDDRIDGIMPQFTQNVPASNPAENLSEGQFNLLGIDPRPARRLWRPQTGVGRQRRRSDTRAQRDFHQ